MGENESDSGHERTTNQELTAQWAFNTFVAPAITTEVRFHEGEICSGRFKGLRVTMQWDSGLSMWVPVNSVLADAKVARSRQGEHYLDTKSSDIFTQKGVLVASKPTQNMRIGIAFYSGEAAKHIQSSVPCDSSSWLLTPAYSLENPKVFNPNSHPTAALVLSK